MLVLSALACRHDPRTAARLHDGAGVQGADPPSSGVPGSPLPVRSTPLFGGGAASSERWTAASDPEGNRVVVWRSGTVLDDEQPWLDSYGVVTVPVGWDPGPLTFDEAGHLEVLLRGPGALMVAELLPEPALDIPMVLPVCGSPRALARDADRARTWVTCGDGALVEVGDDGAEAVTWLDPDLGDIVVLPDGDALIARVRAAEVLRVDLDTGEIVRRDRIPAFDGFTSHVARRMVPWRDGAVVAFQMHSDAVVRDAAPGISVYGGQQCDGIVRDGIAVVDEGGVQAPMGVVGGPPVDLVLSGDGTVPDAIVLVDGAGVVEGDLAPWRTCAGGRGFARHAYGVPTALVETEAGTWLVGRDPFNAVLLDELDAAPLAMGTTPLALFHQSVGGVACASCHPDGADDGHTWLFHGGDTVDADGPAAIVDPRRTQPLGGGGLTASAPFHWDGSLATLGDLFDEVGVQRMGMDPLDPWALGELGSWIDGLDALPAPGPPGDPALVELGAAVFADPDLGCIDCHNGARYSDGTTADVGTGLPLQVPTLLGVGARTPLMHDGCAATLEDRIDDAACGGGDAHGHTSALSPGDREALLAFLRSL